VTGKPFPNFSEYFVFVYDERKHIATTTNTCHCHAGAATVIKASTTSPNAQNTANFNATITGAWIWTQPGTH
jgi:hypothetical protein